MKKTYVLLFLVALVLCGISSNAHTQILLKTTPPSLTSPHTSITTIGPQPEIFRWSANDTKVKRWCLYVGTLRGATDIFYGCYEGSITSTTVTGLPSDATKVYVTLRYAVIEKGWGYLEAEYGTCSERWLDLRDGTIRDRTTGLVWLKNLDNIEARPLSAIGVPFFNTQDVQIMADVDNLTKDAWWMVSSVGHGNNGLSDGSCQGDWRLPTPQEMETLTSGIDPVTEYNTRGFDIGSRGTLGFWTSKIVPWHGFSTYNEAVFMTIKPLGRFMEDARWENHYIWPVRNDYER